MMTRSVYWGVAILIFLVVTATVWVVLHNNAEIERMKRESAELLPQSDDPSLQHTTKHVSGSPDYQPPPLGETDDTGYWKGNVWHQKPAPQVKQKSFFDFWSEDPDKLWWMWRNGKVPGKEFDAFIRRVIAEYPYSQAALEARLSLGGGEAVYKAALKYHPHSPRLHLAIALSNGGVDPEESVAFAKKALRLLPNSSEDYSHLETLHSKPHVDAHMKLGRGYQRLGDYKSALVHLKTAQRLLKPGVVEGDGTYFTYTDGSVRKIYTDMTTAFYDQMTEYIAAIESGTPRLGPGLHPQLEHSADFPQFSSPPVASPRVDMTEQVSPPTPKHLRRLSHNKPREQQPTSLKKKASLNDRHITEQQQHGNKTKPSKKHRQSCLMNKTFL